MKKARKKKGKGIREGRKIRKCRDGRMHEWKGDREEERKRSEGRKERKKKGRKEGIKITHCRGFYDNFFKK